MLAQDTEILAFGELLKEAVSSVRKIKATSKLSMKAEIELVNLSIDEKYLPMFSKTENDLKACLAVRNIEYKSSVNSAPNGEPRED